LVDISHIQNIAVIGAGVQGHSVAQVALMASFKKVFLNDVNLKLIETATNRILNDENYGLKVLESNGHLGEGLTADALIKNLHKEVDLSKAVANADFVIECVPEILEVKQGVFETIGKYAPKHAILATNTSSMSITKIGELSGRQENIIGMHFFPPPVENKLIEVTKGSKATEESLDIGVAVAQKLPCLEGKRLIIRLEKESPAYVANRVVTSGVIYINWVADLAVEKNISYEQLDADILEMSPLGAFLFIDIIGLDTVHHIMNYLAEEISDSFSPGIVLTKLVEQGNLGKKTGKGFYNWPEGRAPEIDNSNKAGMLDIETIIAIMLNEGCRLLEEGIVKGFKTIDSAVSAGFHLPGPFITGKRKYQEYSNLLERTADKTGKNYLKPCELMKSGEFLKMRK
jgi:enoyl-CoA hydratase/3-hydroxyacyl-CoA dehydrogenase